MSVVVTISNEAELNKVQNLLGTKTESETVELALEQGIEKFEQKQSVEDVPKGFFKELFAEETNLTNGDSIQAIVKEREESNR